MTGHAPQGPVPPVDDPGNLLFYGAGDTFAGASQITRSGALASGQSEKIQTVVIPANSRVRAKIATVGGGGDTCDITIKFHRY